MQEFGISEFSLIENNLPTKMMTNISKQLTTGALAIAGGVAAFGFGAIAQAAQLNANAGFIPAFGSNPSYVGANLANATSVTFSGPLNFNVVPPTYTPPGGSSAANDFATGGIAQITNPLVTITPNTLLRTATGPINNFLSFTTIGGAAVFNLTSLVFETTPGDDNVLTLRAGGTIVGTGFDPSPAGLLLNFNQQGGTGAVNFSATLSSPPAFTPPPPQGTPEPSAILGILAVAGAGAFARRKS
jgi:hypothetical protein